MRSRLPTRRPCHTRDQKPSGGQHAQAVIDLGAGAYDHASVVWLDGISSGSRHAGTTDQLAEIVRRGHAGRTGKRCVTENYTRSYSYSCSPTPSSTFSFACAFPSERNQSPNDGPSSFTFNRFSLPGPIRRLDARNGWVRCAHPADTPTNRFSVSRHYLHCHNRSWVFFFIHCFLFFKS